MNDPGHRLPPERVFEALRELDTPSWHEGHPTLPQAISRAIRRGPENPRRKLTATAGLALAAGAALAMFSAWAWSTRAVKAPDPAPVAHHARPTAPGKQAALIRNARGTVVAARNGDAFVVSSGEAHALAEGSMVTTAVDSRAEIELPSGVLVGVSQSTRLVVTAAGELEINVALAMGRVTLEVPKVKGGRRVSVETPDAKVVVRGTKFAVDVMPHDSPDGMTTITSVEVSRGSVFVLREGAELLLTSGESWSSAVSPQPLDLDRGTAPDENVRAAQRQASDVETLTEENRLFQEALDARNTGDHRKAARLLADLLTRFPKSPMAHEARVERFRALEQGGEHAEAVSEARRYLQAYPGGSMAPEARAIIEAAPRIRPPRP